MTSLASKTWFVLRRLSLGITLICAASAFLLVSDLKNRQSAENGDGATANQAVPKVAMLKFNARPLMEEVIDGMKDGLDEKGYVNGKNIELLVRDAQGSISEATTIAQGLTDGTYDLVMTASTPCMQAVANANKQGKCKQVFGAVTDPFGAGVGISRENPLDHPAHLVGIGTFQPVESLFRIIKNDLNPDVKKVGVVWNPAEACSEACTVKARAICTELDIELLEANVDKSADVPDAANALISRGAEAIWVGGDNTVDSAIAPLVEVAHNGHIPVCTNMPGNIADGVLVGLGANYRDVGMIAGRLAAKVLDGADTTKIPIENVVPEKLAVNRLALADLNPGWGISKNLLDRADIIRDKDGTREKKAKEKPKQPAASSKPSAEAKPLTKKWRIFLVRYVDIPATEDGSRGVCDGLAEAGLVEGTDYTLAIHSAQGEIATVNSIMDLAKTDEADMVIALCTPTLQAALQRFDKTPIVFSVVASGVEAGAGDTNEDHRPNVTGITTVSDFADMVEILRECMPKIRRIGTLFTPAEVNSVFYKDLLVEAAKKRGIEVVTVPADRPSDTPDAARVLVSKDIDAVCQISDNLCSSCFPSIIAAADQARKPVFGFTGGTAELGSVLALARDYYDAGREAGITAADVMRGADPAKIPFRNVKTTRLIINLSKAKERGIDLPKTLIDRADEVK